MIHSLMGAFTAQVVQVVMLISGNHIGCEMPSVIRLRLYDAHYVNNFFNR